MPKLFADKTIEIDAPASVVWDVLIKDADVWAFAFAEARVESDWKPGSPVRWKKSDGNVFVEGTVTAFKPQKLLRFTVISTGEPEHRALARTEEDGITFELSERDGGITLRVRHGDFSVLKDAEEALRGTMEGWGRTLPKIKATAEWIATLEREGFKDIGVCPIPPNKDLPEHMHDQHTVHMILEGELIIKDNEGTKTYRPGDRVEFPAGTTHKARGSTDTGKMIIGVKA
ncbi:MAG: hypothetical protein JWM56_759, partial [Candidatus Peribacteria bacterium]|nr:hypothetical protein [Candidatus Peribacteria bacterium]